jgi:hypothetical protein
VGITSGRTAPWDRLGVAGDGRQLADLGLPLHPVFDGLDGQQLHDGLVLGDGALELVVEQVHRVQLSGLEAGRQVVGDLHRPFELQLLPDVLPALLDRDALAAEVIPSLASDGGDLELFEVRPVFGDETFGAAQDGAVEATAEAAVGGHHHQLDLPGRAHRQQRVALDLGPGHHVPQDLLHAQGVRTGLKDRLLGATQLGGRDHLHGLGDLLGVVDRFEPLTEVAQGRHAALGLEGPWQRVKPKISEFSAQNSRGYTGVSATSGLKR